jgi:hypothetical protein
MNQGHQALDVNGCGPNFACGNVNATYPIVAPGQLSQPGQVYAIDFQLGNKVLVDAAGNFYDIVVTPGSSAAATISYTLIGTDLTFAIDQGYYQICGLNVVTGEGIMATVFQNVQNLPTIAGRVDMATWSTDGCYCPWEGCISAVNNATVTLAAKYIPNPAATATGVDGNNIAINTPTGYNNFAKTLSFSFTGTLFRTVQGCTTPGIFTNLQAAQMSGGM